MKKIRKVVLITVLVAVLLLLASMVVALMLKDVIIERTLRTIAANNQISLQAKEVRLVLFDDFPNVMLEFADARITPKDPKATNKFEVNIASFRLAIDALKYIRNKEIDIVLVKVQQGSVMLDIPSLLTSPNNNDRHKVSQADIARYMILDVERLEMKEIQLRIKQLPKVDYIQVNSLRASLRKSTQELAVTLDAQAYLYDLGPYHVRETVALEADIRSNNGAYVTKSSTVRVADNEFVVSGNYDLQTQHYQLELTNKKAKLANLLVLANKFYKIADVKPQAQKMSLTLSLKGNTNTEAASVVLLATAANVQAQTQGQHLAMRDVRLSLSSAQLQQPNAYRYRLEVGQLQLPGINYSGAIEGIGLGATPQVQLDGSFDMVAQQVPSLSGWVQGTLSGHIKAAVQGTTLAGVSSLDIEASTPGVELLYQGRRLTMQGSVEATLDKATTQLTLTGAGVEQAQLLATITNYKSLLHEAGSSTHHPATLGIKGKLQAAQVEADTLMAILATPPDKDAGSLAIDLALQVQLKELHYQGYPLHDVAGTLYYNESGLLINQLQAHAFGGQLGGSIDLEPRPGGRQGLYAKIDFSGIAIDKIDYVNQLLEIAPGQLRGTAGGRLEWYAIVAQGTIDAPTIQLKSVLRIDNGHLIDFKPLQALSRFIKPDLLRDVAFNTLENEITISQGVITLPRMEVRSTALNTIVAGQHRLDGDYDYRLTVFLSDIFRRQQRDINNPITDGQNRIFLQIQRKAGVVEARYDKEAMLKSLGDKLQKEVDSFKPKPDGSAPAHGAAPADTRMGFDWDDTELGTASSAAPLPQAAPATPSTTTDNAASGTKPGTGTAPATTAKPAHGVEIEWDE